MSGGHLLCADRSGTKTHCGDVENVAGAPRRRRRILRGRILFHYLVQMFHVKHIEMENK